jgi:DNA-binding transcriptional ArsR family regulator
MVEQERLNELVDFFKALAEENRLKIVGLLAQGPHSVGELAEVLGLGTSTVSHHLSRLASAGLVTARADGHYYMYSLQLETLREMAQRLLHEESLPGLSEELSQDAFERKVMKSFLDADGRIKSIPAQEKKYLVLLGYLAKAFEPDVRYSEKQVNEIIGQYHPDTAMLRRDLVDYGMLAREGGGGSYWRK